MDIPAELQAMDTYTKFNAQFEQMVISFDEFRQSWKQHVVWIEEENDKINNHYPVQIKRNTWATKHAVSQTLNRLTAIDKQLTTRASFLAKRNIFSDHVTLEDCIVDAMQRSPVSCETRAWQFISAVAEAEDSLQGDQLQLETYERQLDEHLHMMEAAITHVTEAIQSEAFPKVCMLHDFKDRLETDLIKGSALEHDERCALEDKLDITRRLLNNRRNLEAAFLAFAALLSEVGVKIARQRLIPEFFHKLSET
jgi:hypothetical protein